MTGVAANRLANKDGLLSAENLNKLSDSDLHKVGVAVTNAYAETVKADPNMNVTDAQIEAYKNQSKKSMGSKENAIAQILIKTDELKSTLSNKIDEAKAQVKAAGIDVDETANNKALQGDGDGGRIQESADDNTSTIKHLPIETKTSVDVKLKSYLLNKDHSTGASKAKWFESALGFTQNNIDELSSQIVFDPKKAVVTANNEFGTKYNQVILLTGANKKQINVTVAWIKNNDGVVRFITAIPSKKK